MKESENKKTFIQPLDDDSLDKIHPLSYSFAQEEKAMGLWEEVSESNEIDEEIEKADSKTKIVNDDPMYIKLHYKIFEILRKEFGFEELKSEFIFIIYNSLFDFERQNNERELEVMEIRMGMMKLFKKRAKLNNKKEALIAVLLEAKKEGYVGKNPKARSLAKQIVKFKYDPSIQELTEALREIVNINPRLSASDIREIRKDRFLAVKNILNMSSESIKALLDLVDDEYNNSYIFKYKPLV